MSAPFHTRMVARAAAAAAAAPAPYIRDPQHLVVMQFNTLAWAVEPEPTDPSDEVSVRAVKFEFRKVLMRDHILALSPDVAVLEEVDFPEEWFGPELAKAGYRHFSGAKKMDETPPRDHTMVLYKTDRVELVTDGVARKFAEGESQFALTSVMRDVAADKTFLIVAQHAKAGRKEPLEDRRIRHAAMVMQEHVPAASAAHEAAINGRVLWVGDFNAGPQTYGGQYPARLLPWLLHESDGASYLAVEGDEDSKVTLPKCQTKWVSAEVEATGQHPAFTTAKMREGYGHIAQTIDYVLFPEGTATCHGFLPCPVESHTDAAPLCLPSPVWGSDHLSQCVALQWLV